MPTTPSDAPPYLVRVCLWSVSKSCNQQTRTPLHHGGVSSTRSFTFSGDGRLLVSSMNALNIASRFVNDIAENIAQTCFLVHPANVEGSSWLKSLLSVLSTVQVRAALGFQFRGSMSLRCESREPSPEVIERMFSTSYLALVAFYLEKDLPTAEKFLRTHLAPVISDIVACLRNFNDIPTEEEISKVAAQRDEPYTAHMVDACFVASGPPPVYELAASVLGSLDIQALPQSSSALQPTSAPDASLASV